MVITDVKYYYYRDQHRAPRVTLCRVRDDLGRYGYGWSICTEPSPHPGDRIQDGQLIRGGRSIARGRAEAALTLRRGIACFIKADGVVCQLYWRPIRRREALAVIRACGGAFGLLACIKERDVLWFPEIMRPTMREISQKSTVSTEGHHDVSESIFDRYRRGTASDEETDKKKRSSSDIFWQVRMLTS